MDRPHRALLIMPPFFRLYDSQLSLGTLPLGVAYLAQAIRRDTDWEVLIYNADFNSTGASSSKYNYLIGKGYENYLRGLQDLSLPIWTEIKQVIEEYRPQVVGITSYSQTFTSACRVAELAKQTDPAPLVVVGGPHPSMVRGQVLKQPWIDLAAAGEGETTIVEILKAVENQSGWDQVSGISWRRDGEVVDNGVRSYITDLDSLPFPTKDLPAILKDYELYPKITIGNVMAIRGCPFNCSYCGSRYIWSRRPRFRSTQNVAEEFRLLRSQGARHVHFKDDCFGVTQDYIKELCAAIKSAVPDMTWSCEIHAKLITPATVKLMKESGCTYVQMGVESGSDWMLKLIRKGITYQELVEKAKVVRQAGLHLETFFMVGFPQETEETLAATVEAIHTFPATVIIYSIFTPYPGTELFQYCMEQGIIDDSYNPSLFNHQSPANYFCPQISRETFTKTIRGLEKFVDRANSRRRLLRYLSWEGLKKAQGYGLGLTAQKLKRLLFDSVAKIALAVSVIDWN